MRKSVWAGLAAAAIAIVTSAAASMIGEPISSLPHWQRAVPTGAAVSILSYNVEGLPWPLAWNRPAAARHIGEDLRTLRARGEQPHVVAVQEAFGAAQKAIGERGGYRYAAYGPAADLQATEAPSSADRAYAAEASALVGETEGAFADSGLAVFSDYPILWTKRIAYPRFACAGWDCLANKGALMVALKVPGQTAPVIVVDTHLNARGASGTPSSRSDKAFDRQLESLRGFIAASVPDGAGLVLAGDFNVGRSTVRAARLDRGLLSPLGAHVAAVELECGRGCRRAVGGDFSNAGMDHSKSIVAYRAPQTAPIRPYSDIAVFGAAANGEMLSDHLGLTVGFL